jgi:predicted nucleotidyltransferase
MFSLNSSEYFRPFSNTLSFTGECSGKQISHPSSYLSRSVHMLTHEQIVKAVNKAATKFPLAKVSYFGSYADGNATEESDLDVLVEFSDDGSLTLLDIIDFQLNLEDELSIRVDVVETPLTEKAQKRLIIRKMVPVYEQTGAHVSNMT